MKISCTWWNTSLSPTKAANRSSDETKEIALLLINEILINKKSSILGLCELSEKETEWLAGECEKINYGVINGVLKENKTTYDTCIIYNRELLKFQDTKNIFSMRNESTLKIAQHSVFEIISDNTELNIFLSHWTSVRTNNPETQARDLYGIRLKDAVDEIWKKDEDAQIILMGDYNDEPFNSPLAYHLMATRDRHLASSKKKRLYNPFWHRIGSDRDYSRNYDDLGFCGTYFHSPDSNDRWRTFDQIILSSGLLNIEKWNLSEESVEIINIPEYTKRVIHEKTSFDHFPVSITIERGAK